MAFFAIMDTKGFFLQRKKKKNDPFFEIGIELFFKS